MIKNLEVIVLAAGRGTRMNSNKPKTLHKIAGKTILYWTIELLKSCGFSSANFVLGYEADKIKKDVNKLGFNSNFIIQDELNGTAKALGKGIGLLKNDTKNILVLFGDDSALYKSKSILSMVNNHLKCKNKATFMILNDQRALDVGGVTVDKNMNIVSVKTLSDIVSQKQKHYILCGAFCFDRKWIQKTIKLVKQSPYSGEYPLPQIIDISKKLKTKVKCFLLKDKNEWESVNSLEGLKVANIKKRIQINK